MIYAGSQAAREQIERGQVLVNREGRRIVVTLYVASMDEFHSITLTETQAFDLIGKLNAAVQERVGHG